MMSGSEQGGGILQMLLAGGTPREVQDYCRKKLAPLYASDETRNTDYIHTLKVYLKNNNDLVHSAEKLFIHRNTMVNRMRKIAELLDVNINAPAVRTEFYTIFQVLDYYES